MLLIVRVHAQVYDMAEFPALAEKYEKLNWRIISKPGGATVKPDEFYTLYGCGVSGTTDACNTLHASDMGAGRQAGLHIHAQACQPCMLCGALANAAGPAHVTSAACRQQTNAPMQRLH